MKIGVFDSGLGGLAIARAIMVRLPEYDYLYLGDTKRVPYGNRSQATIHQFVGEALDYLFNQDCQLIILACNTASAEALRHSQQHYLPAKFPDRRVLGVLIPAVEAAVQVGNADRVGVIATASTIESGSYPRELDRLSPGVEIYSQATPLLVPLVENDGLKYARVILEDYLAPLREAKIDSLILGCTHYCLLKDLVREMIDCPVISQDEVVPEKLAQYLDRHSEIESKLGKTGDRSYRVTDLPPGYVDFVRRLSGEELNLELVRI
ncbi:MAG: glutamate racemase [Chlorobia bacterium]|nr:glutamate racemase [Fimbriimonadaceae bacterium]